MADLTLNDRQDPGPTQAMLAHSSVKLSCFDLIEIDVVGRVPMDVANDVAALRSCCAMSPARRRVRMMTSSSMFADGSVGPTSAVAVSDQESGMKKHPRTWRTRSDPKPKWPIPTIRFLPSVLIWCRTPLLLPTSPRSPQSQGAKDPREVQLGPGKNAYGRSDDFLLDVRWHSGPYAVVVSEAGSGKKNTTASPKVLAWPKPIVNTSSGKDLAGGSDPVKQASHHSTGELAESKAVADDLEPEGTSGIKVSTASIDQKHSKKNTTTYLDFLTPSSWCQTCRGAYREREGFRLDEHHRAAVQHASILEFGRLHGSRVPQQTSPRDCFAKHHRSRGPVAGRLAPLRRPHSVADTSGSGRVASFTPLQFFPRRHSFGART